MFPIHWPRARTRKILVIKMRYIGDTVLVTPLMRALKKAVPTAETVLLLNKETAPIVKGHPNIDHVMAYDYKRAKKNIGYALRFALTIRRYGFDMVIDLTRNDRSAIFTWLSGAAHRIGYQGTSRINRFAYTHQAPYLFGKIHTVDHHLKIAEYLGLPKVEPHPDLWVAPEDIQWVQARLDTAGIDCARPVVLIHPGARRWYKSWPVDRFARIADAVLKSPPLQVVLSGGPGDRSVCRDITQKTTGHAVNLCGEIPLAKLPALIQQSTLLIGNDSAPIHIATAVKTPVIALFGPTRWEDWHPRRPRDKTFSVSYPCRPCGHARTDCPRGSAYCMSEIREETVRDTLSAFFKKKGITIN